LDQLVALISAHPDGLGIEALLRAWANGLQRRLASLVAQGRIQMLGGARAVRYVGAAHSVQEPIPNYTATQLPASAEGREIQAYIRQQRQQRLPVGYQQAFLEQYHPNHTAYLPQRLRDQLHTLGRSPVAQMPAGTFARDILSRLLIHLS
jgi:hypothetical protein